MKKNLFLTVMCLLGFFGILGAQNVVTVTGEIPQQNYYVPVETYQAKSASQTCYTSDMIGKANGGVIEKIAYSVTGGTSTRKIKVYLRNTESDLGLNNNKNIVKMEEADLVFDGEVSFASGWVEMDLSTDFAYTGDNLLVTVYDYTSAKSGDTYFQCFESRIVNEDESYKYATLKKAGSASDPTNEANVAKFSGYNYSPEIQLTFVAGEEPEVPTAPAAPQNLAATATGETTIALAWDAVEDATSYNVYQGTEKVAENLTETTFAVENLTAATTYCYTVTAVKEALESEASAEACATTDEAEEPEDPDMTIVVGEATMESPVAPFVSAYPNSWIEMIYDAAEIGAACTIEKIAFNHASGDAYTMNEISIYMAETTKSTFTEKSDWTAQEDLTLVYSATDKYVGSKEWETFVLDTPYQYSGLNNLVVVVAKTADFMSSAAWYCEEMANTVMFTASDSDASYAQYPTGEALAIYKTRPVLKLLVSEKGTPEIPAPAAPQNLVATATGQTTIALTWDAVEGATSYNVYQGTEKVAENLTETTYAVESLTAATTYCYTVTAVNGDLESEASEEACATTAEEGAEDIAVLISEKFDGYEAGDKIAEKGSAWWTTWSKKPGSAEDGVVAEMNGNKYGHMTYGVDQVLLLGGQQSGVYDLEFDILVPQGKNGYFNILHDFKGTNSTWALESHLHMTSSSTPAAGKGHVMAGGVEAELVCVYDEWMHFRLHVDTDADQAQYYYTLPGQEEALVCEWQWSKDSDGTNTVGRKLDAMDFYPPNNAATSEFYLDNFSFTKIGGDSAPELEFDENELSASIDKDDVTSVELSFENTGSSVAEYTAWVDYGMGEISETMSPVNYDRDPSQESKPVGMIIEEPTLVEVGAMYPASSYGNSVAGTYITHVMYPFLPLNVNNSIGIVEGTPVTFRIYAQGLYGQPGEVLAEKVLSYEEIKPGDWTIAEFDEPVALSGFNVWATVTFTQAVATDDDPNYPMIFDGQETVVPFGDMFRISGTGQFRSASQAFGEVYGNIHVRMVCFGDPVAGGWAELDKYEGVLPIGASETITVDLNSIGLKKGETYEAKLVISTNVPENEMVEIPVSLYVWGENIEENLSDNYNIYPNPTSGQVMVEGENINYVAVYNSVGQLVKVVKTQNNVVDMSAYENGVYYFSIVDNAGQNSVQRVVVAK